MVQIYRPGERKGNRTCVVRGYAGGRQREIATDTTDPRRAITYWNRFKKELGEDPSPRRTQTFGEVADDYMEAVNASKNDCRYIAALKREIGDILIGDVRLGDIQRAAQRLYPERKDSTKNRQAIAPAAAVLHWAAENKLRDYLIVKKFEEDKPQTRLPAAHVRDVLLGNTNGRKNLLLTFLFFQGWRITETLGLRAENIDLKKQVMWLYVSKARAWKEIPMHPATFEALSNADLPEKGKVFSWGDRHNVYRWLRPLCKRLRVTFTPHMARHEYGSKIRDASDLVAVGSWTSEKSTQRYVSTSEDRVKLVHAKLISKGNSKGKAIK